jgi:hypothetical protein
VIDPGQSKEESDPVHGSHMSQTMKSSTSIPSIPSINANNAQDSTFNVAGRDQMFVTNNYNVDRNCDKGIGPINHTTSTELIICLEKIYQWLSAVIPSTNYHGALKVRLEDTGLWFINGTRFAKWKRAVGDFLWICGTRMYSYHLRVIINTELLLQPVPERPS